VLGVAAVLGLASAAVSVFATTGDEADGAPASPPLTVVSAAPLVAESPATLAAAGSPDPGADPAAAAAPAESPPVAGAAPSGTVPGPVATAVAELSASPPPLPPGGAAAPAGSDIPGIIQAAIANGGTTTAADGTNYTVSFLVDGVPASYAEVFVGGITPGSTLDINLTSTPAGG